MGKSIQKKQGERVERRLKQADGWTVKEQHYAGALKKGRWPGEEGTAKGGKGGQEVTAQKVVQKLQKLDMVKNIFKYI